MKRKLTIVAKLALLVGVLPLLIGHAIGNPWYEPADPVPPVPDNNTYTISGGPDPATVIYTDNPLQIYRDYGQEVLRMEAGNTNLAPVTFKREYAGYVSLSVQSSGAAGRLGPLWLHIDSGTEVTSIKLVDSTRTGPTPFYSFSTRFVTSSSDMTAPQVASGPAQGLYVLSGSSDIVAPITGEGMLNVSVDGVQLASQVIWSLQNWSAGPLSFSATTGSVLSVTLGEKYSYTSSGGDLSELWLHLPSGEAVKLAHRSDLSQNSIISAHFLIP